MSTLLRTPRSWGFPLQDFFTHETSKGAWTPELDLSENDKSYFVKVDIPGVSKDQLKVTLEGRVLTLSGEKREVKHEEGDKVHRMERSFGNFTRSVRFDKEVNSDTVQAVFKNGVLNIEVPKSEKEKSKSIQVQLLEGKE